MKSQRNILIAFLLNLFFSVFEFFGGIFTGSVAIISDSIHDLGDSLSIGISFFLEKKSTANPDDTYTYGYGRYSILGAVITTAILLCGSIFVIINSVSRLFNPVEIKYNGMIVFAIVGVVVNLAAAYATKSDESINQKSVNLHMLEDVLNWIVVLAGAIIMRFTDISQIDAVMSICVSGFILINALRNLKSILDLFLIKIPHGINIDEIKSHLLDIYGVIDVHHIHIWSIDGTTAYATLHAVTDGTNPDIKHDIRTELKEHNITHVTIETESPDEKCDEPQCHIDHSQDGHRHHHHHHHNH